MATLRLLIRPTLFTAGVCGTCLCGSAIVHYENRKRPFPTMQDWITAQTQRQRSMIETKYLKIRQNINTWKNQLSTGQKIAYGTIFLNSVVLLAWRFNTFRPVMMKYFVSQTSTTKIPLSPMILSCFSHSMPLHFAFNMYALYSFSNFATALLGPEQLVGLFISAGVVSSLTSIAHRLITKRTIPSLGASGALLGVIAYVCVARPQSELLLFFIPIAAGNAIKALMVIDIIGVIARWRYIDHAAHLGGSLFGVWYATYGEKIYYQHRRDIVNQWVKLKKRYE